MLSRLQEDGTVGAEQPGRGLPALPTMVAYERPRRDIGFHFVDQVAREAKSLAGIEAITANSYTVRSTINPQLQRAVEEALQEGLWRYERSAGRVAIPWRRGQPRQSGEADRGGARRPATSGRPGSRRSRMRGCRSMTCTGRRRWWWRSPPARRARAWRVGLADGRILPLSVDNAAAQRKLALHDVVLVRVTEARARAPRAPSCGCVRPVQGAVVVLENKTGRVLAMTGGFSYPLSQLNRATQAVRQPGSAIKPLSYLAALGNGPAAQYAGRRRADHAAADRRRPRPRAGLLDAEELRRQRRRHADLAPRARELAQSRDRPSARRRHRGQPEASLDRLCELALEAQIYRECLRYYPFVLGAQPVRPIDLAAFYAAIANEGLRPSPYVVEFDRARWLIVYRHDPKSAATIGSVDRAAFYQLKTMLQGVLARGTARSIASLAPYVAGKTGTSDDENDAWFVGFTNDVTVAVWLGYDNADGKRRTLGGGSTGGGVAVPIFEPVIQAVWAHVAPEDRARPAVARGQAPARLQSRSISTPAKCRQAGGRAITECFRIDRNGQVLDTQYRLVSREDAYVARESARLLRRRSKSVRIEGYFDQQRQDTIIMTYSGAMVPAPRIRDARAGSLGRRHGGSAGRDPRVQAPPQRDPYGREYQTPQRIDPGYLWGNRRRYY